MNLNELHIDTEVMKEFFEKRTERHIELVKKYAQKIADTNLGLVDVVKQASEHDASKYKNPEHEPYLYITWNYKCKDEGKDFTIPSHIKDSDATLHHVQHNRHHPEFHGEESCDKSINRNDRDAAPEKVTDATKMNDIDVAEMVADWCAMSEEKESCPKDWAEKNINKRWNFTDDQVKLIYKLIDDIWKGLSVHEKT
jgi:hypothetical protein